MNICPLKLSTDILDFWFADNHKPYWFAKDEAFDALITEKFGHGSNQLNSFKF
jgi:uncharacterized protein (DUF924 family)